MEIPQWSRLQAGAQPIERSPYRRNSPDDLQPLKDPWQCNMVLKDCNPQREATLKKLLKTAIREDPFLTVHEGINPMGGPCPVGGQFSLSLTNCAQWKAPTLKQYVENCRS